MLDDDRIVDVYRSIRPRNFTQEFDFIILITVLRNGNEVLCPWSQGPLRFVSSFPSQVETIGTHHKVRPWALE